MSRFRSLSPDAAGDLESLIGWMLDEGASPATAERVLAAVLQAAELLASRPMLGRQQPDLLLEPFRVGSIPRHRLLLVYDPTATPAIVVRVVSTDRDLAPLLAGLGDPAEPEDPSLRPRVFGAHGLIAGKDWHSSHLPCPVSAETHP